MSNETLKKNFISQLVSFLKKKFKIIIFLLAILIILLFAYLVNINLQNKNNVIIAEQYTNAKILIKQKKVEESKILLESIISKNHQIYSPLALYLIIDNNIEPNTVKIFKFFDTVLKNSSIDKENLNLIKIKKSIYLINLDNEEQIIGTLNPIINSNSLWRKMAINLISEYFLSKGELVKAEEYIKLLNEVKN